MNTITQHNIIIPIRKENAHKGTHGNVAIIGGASGMLGAVVLASRASASYRRRKSLCQLFE
jgi:NAD(P)H-hydrate repair Nnr-like enzyme with NAD(P)H-hydrate dehydratase domain